MPLLLEVEGSSKPMSGGGGGGSVDKCTSDTCGRGEEGSVDEEYHVWCEGEGREGEVGR